MPSYLLIIGCSQKKDPSPYPMKALDRYEGVTFKVLKKFKRERVLPRTLDIVIISAQYGFLRADDLIHDYDVRMTKKRALELQPQILQQLKELISHNTYQEVFINLGKDYLPAIKGIENLATCPIGYAGGRIGEKMAATKQWITRVTRVSEHQKTLNEVLQ